MTDDDRPGGLRDAFSLLSHEIRLEVLLASLEEWQAVRTEPQRYSELMRAVGMRDSGKFNYHLDRLRGPFLRKTEDGYVPTAAAMALYRAVLAHRPTETPSRSEFEPDRRCPDCDAALEATYERDFFTVECPACGSDRSEMTYPLPANALEDRTDDELLRAMCDRARAHVGLARSGQCPECAGATTVTLQRGVDDEDGDGGTPTAEFDGEVLPVRIACDTCRWVVQCRLLLALVSDARVAGALAHVGAPVEPAVPWELPTPASVSVDRTGIELAVEGPGGTASVSVDRDLAVRSVSTSR